MSATRPIEFCDLGCGKVPDRDARRNACALNGPLNNRESFWCGAGYESGWDDAIRAMDEFIKSICEKDQAFAPMLNDADVVAAVRGAADESATNSTRIGAPGSEIREKYATQAAMLYAAAARLEALLKAAQDAQ